MTVTDQTQIIGAVFVHQGQRVLDLLCDERPFFPIKTTAGVRLLNKQHAVLIDLMPVEEMREKRELLPDVDFQYLRSNAW
ncbi:DUF6812 domain-containing protein [Rhabdonatronobacter sediminivivens]|uniref:DUF6812 domain-containing protein n=1 Tax=Rhabdonatronobacter sediminivivens TaxID=2743469 RepID=UPI00389B18F9